MPQLHSNFELNSKLSNFTRDSFKTWDEMVSVNPNYIDEGHISYCVDLNKHFVFHTDKNKNASWIELIPSTLVVDDVTGLDDALAESLQPGSLVFVKDIDKLYYKGDTKYRENQGELSGYFHPILTVDEISTTYLSKDDASTTYLSISTAEETYLSKKEAKEITDSLLSKDDATATYLSKNDATKTYLSIGTAEKTYLSKTEAENSYAKKEDVAGLIDNYIPNSQLDEAIIAVDIAEDLRGQSGKQISDKNYEWNDLFDKILFKEVIPNTTIPSLEILFLIQNWIPDAKCIDNTYIVSSNTIAPDSGCFKYTNVKDAEILYNYKAFEKYTNNLIINSAEKKNSKVFCKVLNENGEWEYFKHEDDLYHIPTNLTAGNYRYYYVGYFNKSNVVCNNKGVGIKSWNENTPIESTNYISINVTKPVKYNTENGMVDNELIMWSNNMVDYFELKPTCQAVQKFMLPRKAKHIYVWNDLCGYAEDLSFEETVNNDYFIYSYNHTINGHRGAIKIKVEF